VPSSTLAQAIGDERVEFDELEDRYRPMLALVKTLIGVVPNCDPYLEIWQPGFRTYNLLVPNFLNLPASLIGIGAPKDVVGLAMYTSSRAASCAYCSAHTCSFALRRGSRTEAVTGQSRTQAESAAVAVAEGLSTVPHHYTREMGDELRRHFSPGDTEWIVLSVAMMGFLNKFMDAMGVELEPEAIRDVEELIEPTGWSAGQHLWNNPDPVIDTDAGPPPVDSMSTMLPVARNAPSAIWLERGWMQGIPRQATKARSLIATEYGFDEPLLTTLTHGRPRRALTAMLRHNLDPAQSALGIGRKALAGLVFATTAENQHLVDRAQALAERYGIAADVIEAAAQFTPGGAPEGTFDSETLATLTMAHAIAPSPAEVDASTIELGTTTLTAAQIVEVAVWVSISQLLHRLHVFFR
jgi:hypothetical protein